MGTGCKPHFLEVYTGPLLCSLGSHNPEVQETGKERPKMVHGHRENGDSGRM